MNIFEDKDQPEKEDKKKDKEEDKDNLKNKQKSKPYYWEEQIKSTTLNSKYPPKFRNENKKYVFKEYIKKSIHYNCNSKTQTKVNLQQPKIKSDGIKGSECQKNVKKEEEDNEGEDNENITIRRYKPILVETLYSNNDKKQDKKNEILSLMSLKSPPFPSKELNIFGSKDPFLYNDHKHSTNNNLFKKPLITLNSNNTTSPKKDKDKKTEKELFLNYSKNDCEFWYLNFSHQILFCSYSGGLFAQDEHQVLEHCQLGSIYEYCSKNRKKLEKKHNDFHLITNFKPIPTPIIISKVKRFVEINTLTGLYGNNFAYASKQKIDKNTKVLSPAVNSNIICMEALPGGYGYYTKEEIVYTINTVCTGFYAAIDFTKNTLKKDKCVIHCGNFGCGAYGGNCSLITVIQILCAYLMGVDGIVYHYLWSEKPFNKGLSLFKTKILPIIKDSLEKKTFIDINKCIEVIFNLKFEWGVSDGN